MRNSSFSSSLSGEDAFNDHYQRQHEEDSEQQEMHRHHPRYQTEVEAVAMMHFAPQTGQKVKSMDEEAPSR